MAGSFGGILSGFPGRPQTKEGKQRKKAKSAAERKSQKDTGKQLSDLLNRSLAVSAAETAIRKNQANALARSKRPAPEEEAFAAMDFGPSAPMLSAPSLASVLSPFALAEKQTNDIYGRTTPQIAERFDQLRGNLATADGEYARKAADMARLAQGRYGELRGALQGEQAANAASTQALTGGVISQLAAPVAAAAAQQQSNLTADETREQILRDDQARAIAQTQQARGQDSQVIQQSAMNAATQARDSSLLNIAGQKAAATAEQQQMEQQVAMKNYELQLAQQSAMAQAATSGEDRQMKLMELIPKLTNQLGKSGREYFSSMEERRLAANPNAMTIVNDLIGAYKTPGQAISALRKMEKDLKTGKAVTKDADDNEIQIKSKLDPKWIEARIREYYDEEKKLTPAQMRQLGLV